MSFTAGSITGTIGLNNKPALDAMKGVEREAKNLKSGVTGNMEEAGVQGAKGFFKGINAEMGKKSIMGQSMKLMLGGGAIAGIGMAAHAFESFSESIEGMADAFRKGDESAGEIWGNFLRGVPILGSVTKGFDALREAITGEKAAMEEDAKYVKASEEAWKTHLNAIEKGTAITFEWAQMVQKLREELRLLNANPEDKGFVAAQQTTEDKLAGVRAKYELEAGLELANGKGPGALITKNDEVTKAQAELGQRRAAMDHANVTAKAWDDYMAANRHGDINSDHTVTFTKEDVQNSAAATAAAEKATKAFNDQVRAVQTLHTEFNDIRDQSAAAALAGMNEARGLIFAAGAKQEADAKAKGQTEYWGTEFKKRAEAHMDDESAFKLAQDVSDKVFENQKQALAASAEEGKRLTEAMATPAEKLGTALAVINELRRTGDISDVTAARAGDKALADSLGTRQFMQLANPRLQAEELRGAKTVTTADVPQPFVEIQRSEAATAQNTARIAAGIEKLVSQGNRADSSVNQVATLSLP